MSDAAPSAKVIPIGTIEERAELVRRYLMTRPEYAQMMAEVYRDRSALLLQQAEAELARVKALLK